MKRDDPVEEPYYREQLDRLHRLSEKIHRFIEERRIPLDDGRGKGLPSACWVATLRAMACACWASRTCSRTWRCPFRLQAAMAKAVPQAPAPMKVMRGLTTTQSVYWAAAPACCCSYMAWKLISARCTGGKPARVMRSATLPRR